MNWLIDRESEGERRWRANGDRTAVRYGRGNRGQRWACMHFFFRTPRIDPGVIQNGGRGRVSQ